MKRIHSLKNKKVFNQFFDKNKISPSIKTKNFVLLWSKNIEGIMKLGIVIPKRKFNAVKRNKMKRIVREMARIYLIQEFEYNFLIIIKKSILLINKKDLNQEFADMVLEFKTLCKI